MNTKILREGIRIFTHAITANINGPKRYEGSASEICHEIIEQCYNERYYQTSINNYPCFYARDFGMCVDSLLALGKRKEVLSTLHYALEIYTNEGFTQQINPEGKTFQYPMVPQPDALAFILHAIHAVNDISLRKYDKFLTTEIVKFSALIDPQTKLVKKNIHIAGMRDHAIRESSCYDNVMLLAINKYSKLLKLNKTLSIDKRNFLTTFWNNDHFKNDLSGKPSITGDANVLPFWFDIAPKKYWKLTLATIQRNKLDHPYPLRYESTRNHQHMIPESALTNGWEHDTCWLHLGNLFLQVLAKHDPERASEYLHQHRQLIEEQQNYPEVLSKNGKPHRSFFFHSDDSMLWAANFLALSQLLQSKSWKK